MNHTDLLHDVSTVPHIDARSFHVFELEGDRLLFDRSTATTSEISDIAFDVLRRIREGVPVAEAVARSCESGTSAYSEMLEALHSLKQRGFFRFTEVAAASDEAMEALWSHRPRRIQLLMAEGCNLGCRYCYQWRNGTNQLHTLMPWTVARAAVDHLVWRSGGRTDLQVTFFGGEPLLNYPMIRKVVEYCRGIERASDRRFLFELITNGTLLTEDVVNFISENKFLLFISLDGWKEMHNYNRPAIGGDDMYDTILKNALHAKHVYESMGLPNIKVRANLTNRFHDKQAVISYFESLGFKLIGVGPIEPLPHGDPSPSALSDDQMDELQVASWSALLDSLRAVKSGAHVGPGARRGLNQLRQPMKSRDWLGVTCGVCRNTTIVDNRGNMYPCHRYAEMKAFCIGNVFTGMSREAVIGYYRKINGLATDECQNCWIRDYCGGGCAWLLSDKDGNVHHATPRECNRRRRAVEQGLWMRKELRKVDGKNRDAGNDCLDKWDWNVVASVEGTEGVPAAGQSRAWNGVSLPVIQSSCSSTGSCGSCPSSGAMVTLSTVNEPA